MAKTFFDSLNKQLATLDQLREMDRDLRFRPNSPQGARTLTAAQIEGFNQDGFIMPVRAFDRDQVLEERRYFDHLLEETLAEGSDSYSVVDPHMSDARVYDLMFEPCFVEPVRDLIGDDIVCWTTHYLCKMPGEDQQITWHQDAFYWPLTPSKTVSIWLAIDDVDRENGCMQFASGSHRYGPIEHRLSRNDEKNVLRFTVDDIESHGGGGGRRAFSRPLFDALGPAVARIRPQSFRPEALRDDLPLRGDRRTKPPGLGKDGGAHQRARPHGTMGQPAAARWLKRFTGGNTTIPPLSEDP